MDQNVGMTKYEEKVLKGKPGLLFLCVLILLMIGFVALFIFGVVVTTDNSLRGGLLMGTGVVGFVVVCIMFAGIRIIMPNEALVMVLLGEYVGTIRKQGIYFVNPFSSAISAHTVNTQTINTTPQTGSTEEAIKTAALQAAVLNRKRVSLKVMTLDNNKQKVNDLMGNPVIVGMVITWRVVDTAKALFVVDNYYSFIEKQCDAAIRDIIRLYPYDSEKSGEVSLRGSSQEIADKICAEIQEKVQSAGLEVMDARITHLSYSEEIAAIMLQRQQASAIVDARQKIVEGAVGMVEMALERLNEKEIVQLDEERKAAMVSNLLVVLCGNKDAQPIVNSGSLY